MIAALSLLLLLPVVQDAPACEQPLSLFELGTVLDDAEQAMGRSGEVFDAASGYGAGALPCLEDVVEPTMAARLHRMMGMRALVKGDRDQALAAFAASHRIEPSFAFPDEVFAASHPISRLYVEAAETPVGLQDAEFQPATVIWYDGVDAEQRPEGVPVLAQRTTEWGALLATAYLWPDDPAPAVPPQLIAALPRPEPPEPDPEQLEGALPVPGPELRVRAAGEPPPWLRTALVSVASASAVAAGASAAFAGATAADYRNNPHSLDELDQLKARNNTLVYTAGGLGLVAAGAGVGVAVTW